jgi:putative inorganic carbon (HCO3(-)) transporter
VSATALVWVVLFAVCLLASFKRPVWALALYMQTFFAAPHLWWWGDEVPSARYALWAGVVLLLATVVFVIQNPPEAGHRSSGVHKAAILMIVNAGFVQAALAVDRAVSLDTFVELLKYVLLFYLIWTSIRDKRDFRFALLAIAIGASYIGYEVTINDRGEFSGSRLEGVGAPAADNSNSLASLMLTALPLVGSLFLQSSRWTKLTVLGAAPMVLNVILLCNSRGAFLGLIGAAVSFIFIARGQARKRALTTMALGGLALFLLLGDPKILDRFSTTFVGSEERDNSAESRLEFWKAGGAMLMDYPLGAGGGSFKYSIGLRYLKGVQGEDAEARSLHNGYLTEATDWGVQGLALKLAFVGLALMAAYRTAEKCRKAGQLADSIIGLCVIVSGVGLMIHCFFGAFLANEWTYWVVALLVRYSELYKVEEKAATEVIPTPAAA